VVTFGDVPEGLLGMGCQVRRGNGPADVEGSQYIVLTMEAFRAFHGGGIPAALGGAAAALGGAASGAGCCSEGAGGSGCSGGEVDLTAKRLIHERDLKDRGVRAGMVVKIASNAILTALARDYVNALGATLVRV
jgi:hypothetical protein